jgi:dethiobiotin synthetase
MTKPLRLFVLGTDTDVGKTVIVCSLLRGLRRLGRQVQVHKPVACGDWDPVTRTADDGRRLLPFADSEQSPESVCPHQFEEPASPHLAAAAMGIELGRNDLIEPIAIWRDDVDLVVEGAGGPLAPLAADGTNACDLALALGWPALLVTRPHLGTLNHSGCAAEVLARRGIPCLGLVLNYHEAVAPSLAVRTAAEELPKVTGLPILHQRHHAPPHDEPYDDDLATAVVAAAEKRR